MLMKMLGEAGEGGGNRDIRAGDNDDIIMMIMTWSPFLGTLVVIWQIVTLIVLGNGWKVKLDN